MPIHLSLEQALVFLANAHVVQQILLDLLYVPVLLLHLLVYLLLLHLLVYLLLVHVVMVVIKHGNTPLGFVVCGGDVVAEGSSAMRPPVWSGRGLRPRP